VVQAGLPSMAPLMFSWHPHACPTRSIMTNEGLHPSLERRGQTVVAGVVRGCEGPKVAISGVGARLVFVGISMWMLNSPGPPPDVVTLTLRSARLSTLTLIFVGFSARTVGSPPAHGVRYCWWRLVVMLQQTFVFGWVFKVSKEAMGCNGWVVRDERVSTLWRDGTGCQCEVGEGKKEQ